MSGRGKDRYEEPVEAEDTGAAFPCWLCLRPMGEIVQWHHPVPRAKKGRAVVPVHPICHKTIHANFTNNELARIGDNRATIMANQAVAKFVDWVSTRPPDFDAPTR